MLVRDERAAIWSLITSGINVYAVACELCSRSNWRMLRGRWRWIPISWAICKSRTACISSPVLHLTARSNDWVGACVVCAVFCRAQWNVTIIRQRKAAYMWAESGSYTTANASWRLEYWTISSSAIQNIIYLFHLIRCELQFTKYGLKINNWISLKLITNRFTVYKLREKKIENKKNK